eukprot:TRINITY_DN12070_c0_g1_i1.p1 TRINITY_DN12070_c0_g1~~TRINITY_DN12070_c0_g1_i1.p1  ORF type:complete len:256 (-),score=17.30 TRINITY_DN12070_c0_g1_i1:402-1169(-)
MPDLGCMRFEMTGPQGFVHALGGMTVGWVVTVIAFQVCLSMYPVLAGPAADAEQFSLACRMPMLATAAWCFVYYNMIGANVISQFAIHIVKMIPPPMVNFPQYTNISARFSGNSAEHAPVFLTSLWLYTVFVDSSSAGVIGFFYVAQRLLYPFIYMVRGEFDFYFEYITQIGYGMIGTLLLGVVVQGTGGEWVSLVTANPVLYATLGFVTGSFPLFPGLPFAPLYAYLHYKIHRAFHSKPPATLETATLLNRFAS